MYPFLHPLPLAREDVEGEEKGAEFEDRNFSPGRGNLAWLPYYLPTPRLAAQYPDDTTVQDLWSSWDGYRYGGFPELIPVTPPGIDRLECATRLSLFQKPTQP